MLWVLIRSALLFVCVKVLWPSQLNGVMLSTVSFPNHFYWAGLVLQAVNQYCAHSFARNWQLTFLNMLKGENDSWRKRMTEKIFDDHISTKECCRPRGCRTCNLLITSRTHIQLSDWGRASVLSVVICSNFLRTFHLMWLVHYVSVTVAIPGHLYYIIP